HPLAADPEMSLGLPTTLPGDPAGAGLPLAGIRVLDASTQIAGPMCARFLADLGASVIKLESPAGDSLRLVAGRLLGWNPGKRGVVVDLASAEGREIGLALARRSDVLVHNWRPAVAERLGFTYERLAAENPRLTYCTITGFGERGPESGKPAWDPILQARA